MPPLPSLKKIGGKLHGLETHGSLEVWMKGTGGLVYQPPNGKIPMAPESHGKSLP